MLCQTSIQAATCFLFHFYVAGALDTADSLCSQLATALQNHENPGRRVRMFDSCGRSQEERHAAIDCSAAVFAVLSRTSWTNATFRADVQRAAATGRRVLFVYDPDCRMSCYVDLRFAVRPAPAGMISALLAASDVYPYFWRVSAAVAASRGICVLLTAANR